MMFRRIPRSLSLDLVDRLRAGARPGRSVAITAGIVALSIGFLPAHLHAAGVAAGVGAPIGTVHLTAGWATFGEAVPRGVAFDGVKIGTFDTQTDVKSRWDDGSIRFAIV